jgi:ribosomal protein S18 acetylase RimI-like enzyme
MKNPRAMNKIEYRDGAEADTEECLSLWVAACLARDGAAVVGVAERARPKFDDSECWIVAEDTSRRIVGFGLATKPGSGLVGDPPSAPVVGLLAVAPDAQGRRLGANLLMALTTQLALRGYDTSVLHVLADHHTAVHLYEKMGWRQLGEPFQHSLLRRPTQAYVLDLHGLSAR